MPKVLAKRADWADPDFFSGNSEGEKGLLRILYRQFVPAKGHRTYLTISGWMLILLSLAVGGTAYNSANNILFVTLSLMLSSLVLSGILSVVNFKLLTWKLTLPPELRVGSLAVATLKVNNAKRVFPTFGIWFNVRVGESGACKRLMLDGLVPPRGEASLDWQLRPVKRGELELEMGGVESKYPFCFLRKCVGGIKHQTVWVWPARVDYRFAPLQLGRQHLPGTMQQRLGQGDDLVNIRQYAAGDPPRMVHWKATARLGQLMIRQVAEEAENAYWVQLETSLTTWRSEDTFEKQCSLTVSLAEDLFHKNRLNGYAINDGDPVKVRNLADLRAFFDQVSRLQLDSAVARPRRRHALEWIYFNPIAKGGIGIYVGDEPAGEIIA